MKQNINFNFQPPSAFLFSLFTKIVRPLKDTSEYKISQSHVDYCKLFIRLSCLNVCNFGGDRGSGIKLLGFEVIFNGMTSIPNFVILY